MSEKKRLVVIDGKSVLYRGYYGMANLSLPDGTPTGGVYGFAMMAVEAIKKFDADYVTVAWDIKGTNIRSRLKIFPAYKQNRKPMPEDLAEQIPMVKELLKAFNIPLLECDDYEADDIMGTLAVQHPDLHTILITGDQDMLQLVSPTTTVMIQRKGLTNIDRYTPEFFKEAWGMSVEQFVDYKSLRGDSSDNIPGVKGVGEKTAKQLIMEYGSLDKIYENVALIKGATQNKLIADKEMAYLSKQLVTIQTDAPVKLDLQQAAVDRINADDVRNVLNKFSFKALSRQIPDSWGNTKTGGLPQSSADIPSVKLVDTKPDYKKPVVVFTHNDEIYVSADSKTASKLKKTDELNKSKANVIGYDLKELLKKYPDLKVEHDVRVGAFLINPLSRDQSLSALCGNELDSENPLQAIAAIWQLFTDQKEAFKAAKSLLKVATEIDWKIIPVLAKIEARGIRLNSEFLHKMGTKLADQLSDVEQTIYGFADEEFNISSPSQLAEILYTKLNLPTEFIKKTKSGFSTAHSELEKLKDLHPIIELLFQYREWSKLKSTYVDTLPEQVAEDERIHTNFALDVAATGRLSSNNPNLQNIPVRTELGREIRKAFIPADGYVFVSADYSQFELRIAAALSNEKDMIDAFNDDADIHVLTAAQMYDIKPEEVSKEQRYSAKAVNFGIMYGQGVHGLAQGTGMSYADAKKFIEKYFEIRPNLKKYLQSLKTKAKDEGYVETLLGRRRPTPDVQSSNFMIREGAYRAAINMPMQGTAADITKLAMIELDEKLPSDVYQLVQVHDSVMVECPKEKAEAVAKQMVEIMENVYKLDVKLKVDAAIGDNWGEL